MTTGIIYHDFQQAAHPAQEQDSGVFLTGTVLTKGRRFLKFVNNIGTVVNTTCIAVCCVSSGVSLGILLCVLCS